MSGPRGGESRGWRIGEVAQQLGVSPDTLRTWERRYGLGSSERSAGGHRRYRDTEVAQLRELQQLLFAGEPVAAAAAMVLGKPVEPSARRGGGRGVLALPRTADDMTRGLARAAMALDVETMHRLVGAGLAERGVIEAWETLLVPILISIGDRTDRSGHCVEVEHALSECVLAGLLEVTQSSRQQANPRAGPPVLLCALGDEQHTLPLYALEAALAAGGLATCMLGARMPPEALAAAYRRLNPPVVFLWSHQSQTVEPLQGMPARMRTRVVLGGPGWQPEGLPAGVTRTASLSEAVQVVEVVRRRADRPR